MNKNGKRKEGKKGKVLDLNTKILIGIRDELREINTTVHEHTTILHEHTSILLKHEQRLEGLESAVKDLAKEMRKWVGHFDRDYMRLANEVDSVRARLQRCEEKLALQ